jgi:ABC-type uncharacterized transport system substrate-binding protein
VWLSQSVDCPPVQAHVGLDICAVLAEVSPHIDILNERGRGNCHKRNQSDESSTHRIVLRSDLAAELVRLKVDLIFTETTPAARAAKQATITIPVVFNPLADPVREGFVVSLARPGA